MKHLYFLMALLLYCPVKSLQAQYRPLGAVPEDSIYQRVPLAPEVEYGKDFYFPESHSLKEYCPPVGDQGDYASCVGWACSYALSIALAQKSRIDNRSPHLLSKLQLSALYIYNQIKLGGDCYYGARTSDAMLLLKNQGDCRTRLFPNDLTCEERPGDLARSEALLFKITDYWRIFNVQSPAKEKVDLTKKRLIENKPLVVAMEVTPSFMENQSGIWKPNQEESKIGLHTMVVVGYDEQYFELLNSFGPDWGNGGFTKITHEDYAEYVRYAYVMCLDKEVSCSESAKSKQLAKVQPLYGSFDLMVFQGNDTTGFSVNCRSNDHFFSVTPDYTHDLFFQVQVKEIAARANVYFLAIDAEGNAIYLDEVRKLYPSVTPMPYVIPRGGHLFSFEKSDWLCILLSHEPVLDARQKIAAMSSCTGSVWEKLHCAFGTDVIKERHIIRWPDEPDVALLAQPHHRGVIPIFFKFE